MQSNPQSKQQNKSNLQIVKQVDRLYSPETEQACIGAVLINPNQFDKINIYLDNGRAFFELKHRYIWQAMEHLTENEMAIDTVTICDVLRERGVLVDIGGPAYLTRLIKDTPTSVHAEVYARLVERVYNRSLLFNLGEDLKQQALNSSVALEQSIATIQSKIDNTLDSISRRIISTMQDYANDHLDMSNDLLDSGQTIEGINTGIPGLHNTLGALYPGTYICGGRPHNGKTITLMTIAINAAIAGKNVLYVNNADGDESTVFNSFLSMVCGLPPAMLRRRTWNEQQRPAYMDGLSTITGLPLFITHKLAITPGEINAKAAIIQRTHGLDMIVVDYIQRCGVGVAGAKVYPTKKMQVDYASSMMNELRKKYNVPVLYGAQLLRQASDDVQPRFEHLKESGNIAEDADVALILWQQDRKRKELTISIEKNRETHCYESFRVSFNGVTGQLAK